ncbi:MAG: hypothetical protein ACTTIC_07230 [Helicobacteraceae bacterium]
MDCLDEIKEMNLREVSEKTHISITELEALIKKDFSKFNHTKAVGFTKIFKRDYGIDLTPWLKAYEQEADVEKEEIFIVPETKKRFFNFKFIYILFFILVVILGIILYSAIHTGSSVKTDRPEATAQAAKVIESAAEQATQDEAQENSLSDILGTSDGSDENNSTYGADKDADLGAGAEENLSTNSVQSTQEAAKDPQGTYSEQGLQTSTPSAQNAKAAESADKTQANPLPASVSIRSYQDLWIGVKNETTGKSMQTTINGEFKLNPEHNYTIVFGHGFFNLIADKEVIKSKLSGLQQYSFRNGKFTKEAYRSKKPAEENDAQ